MALAMYTMARPLRIEYAGAVYHVTVRGNQRINIFRSTQDRERFLIKLEESAQRYDVSRLSAVLKQDKSCERFRKR